MRRLPPALGRVFLAALVAVSQPLAARAAPPLASWNEGPAKTALLEFVAAVAKPGARGFVPPAERIAVFDNDGTLWT